MKLPNASTVLLAALVILKASDSSVTATKLDGLKEKSEISRELENISFASSPTQKLLRANEEVVKNEKVRTNYFQKDKLAYYKQVGSDIVGMSGGSAADGYQDSGQFGDAVATNDDGTIIVVAGPAYESYYADCCKPGGVYVFQFKDDKWMEYGTIPRAYRLGSDVSISDDGKHIGIVAKEGFYWGSTVVRYSLDESSDEQVTWKNVGGYISPCSILYEDDPGYYNYGCGGYYSMYDKTKSIKFTPDGSRLVIGAKAALVFDYDVDLDKWELVGDKIVGAFSYGKTATINDDGNKVVIEDKYFAQLYELENNKWVKLGSPTRSEASDLIDIDTNSDCTRVATVTSRGEVRMYQFEILSGLWTQLGSALKGFSRVSMNKDGNHIAAGSDGGAGYAEMFNYNIEKDEWVQAGDTIRGETEGDDAGRIAISGNGERVIVGAPNNDDGGVNAGKVRAFELGYYQTIQIVTNYDFDGKGKEWCLEPKKQKKNQPLQVRPCTSGKKKQVWFHDNLNRLRLFEKPWFCAVKTDRTFVVGKCKDQKTAEDAIIKFDSKIGSIYIEKPVGILRLGIDMRNNWRGKRARVYALASTNPSVDTWSFKKL